MRSSAARLLVANAVTLFGSAFAFVPLGAYFVRTFPPGLGFPLFLGAKLVPGLLLAHWYAQHAARLSPQRVIMHSQWVAGLASLSVIAAVQADLPVVALVAISIGIGFSASLKSLFPALLNIASGSAVEAHKKLSRWYFVRAFALMVATASGGYLAKHLPLEVFLAIDAATFAVAFYIWKTQPAMPLPLTPPPKVSLRDFAGTANMTNFWRNIFFSVFGALFPMFVLDRLGGDTTAPGNLYLFVGGGTVAGSYLAGHLTPTFSRIFAFSVLELGLVYASAYSHNLTLYIALVAVSCVLIAGIEVWLQTAFIASAPRERSSGLSAVFQAGENAASLVGYGLTALLAGWRLDPRTERWLVGAFALLSMAQLYLGRARFGEATPLSRA